MKADTTFTYTRVALKFTTNTPAYTIARILETGDTSELAHQINSGNVQSAIITETTRIEVVSDYVAARKAARLKARLAEEGVL